MKNNAKPRRTVRDLVFAMLREHGPADDNRLASILKNNFGVPDESTRGRRADLVRMGLVKQVGCTKGGRGRRQRQIWDVTDRQERAQKRQRTLLEDP